MGIANIVAKYWTKIIYMVPGPLNLDSIHELGSPLSVVYDCSPNIELLAIYLWDILHPASTL